MKHAYRPMPDAPLTDGALSSEWAIIAAQTEVYSISRERILSWSWFLNHPHHVPLMVERGQVLTRQAKPREGHPPGWRYVLYGRLA